MKTALLNKAELTDLLNRLIEHYRVYAPVRQKAMTSFQQISSGELVDLSCVNTTLPPKSLMLPQSESMFAYTVAKESDQAGILREIEKDYSPRVIFAIRPCDAKSFQILDLNFDTASGRDPMWLRRRQNTTLVGIGCSNPCSTCFCTSVGSGPFSVDGLDLLFTDMGDEFAIRALTEKGGQLLKHAGISAVASEAATKSMLKRQQLALQSIKSVVQADSLRRQDAMGLFNAGFWDEVQFACISCGVCTFVCPTCWCFDIQDEVHGTNGIRLRNWDACMFPLFTLHGSGHNPRAQKLQRVRQRFMHKLKYFVDKYGSGVACVGCGRCVEQCPVNIDIRQVFQWMNSFKSHATGPAS